MLPQDRLDLITKEIIGRSSRGAQQKGDQTEPLGEPLGVHTEKHLCHGAFLCIEGLLFS
jgi:hypothetical protein